MPAHNPNNWHWVDKDVKPWAQSYLREQIIGLEAGKKGGLWAQTNAVDDFDGDSDATVSNRKGRVITIYDLKVVIRYKASTGEKDDIKGTITIPEVAHDTETDEYVFDIGVQNESTIGSNEASNIKDLVRSDIVPQIRNVLGGLQKAMADSNSKDVLSSATVVHPEQGKGPGSKTLLDSSDSSKVNEKISKVGHINTSNLTDSYEFQTTKEELYNTFIDPQRVAAWSRSRPIAPPKNGGQYELFQGNVQGEFVHVDPISSSLVQTWRLRSWPEGQFARLEYEFDQGSDGTTLKVKWNGVPIGQEDTVRTNFYEYYVKPIKLIFGFGAIL